MVSKDATAPELAVETQWRRRVDRRAVVVPRAVLAFHHNLRMIQWTLACQVDDSAWRAIAIEQAVRAAQQFGMVVFGHVDL